MNEILEVVLKAEPKNGDVIVLRLPSDYPMTEVWDRLESLQGKGVQVLAITDEVQVTTIKNDGSYLVTLDRRVPQEHLDRMKAEWAERFPGSRVMFIAQASVEAQADGLDTL